MPNKYIEFVKAHPILPNETAQERISRVAQLWREYKQQNGGFVGMADPNIYQQPYQTGFIPRRPY